MKLTILFWFYFSVAPVLHAQNVGIGTNNPTQKLEVNGGIRVGNTSHPVAGTIRFNEYKNDFEGYNGKAWVSLTGGKTGWGHHVDYSYENAGGELLLHSDASGNYGTGLGWALCTEGEYLLTGASSDYNASNGLANAGTVRIFRKSDGDWNKAGKLASPFPAVTEKFGSSISISNGYFVVGAPGSNNYRGRIYFFRFNAAGDPEYLSNLAPGDGEPFDRFGGKVSLSGNTVIVGSRDRKVGMNDKQGRASIYIRNAATGAWQHVQHLYAPDGVANDYYGDQVFIDGTVAAVSSDVLGKGKVYLYRFNNGSWKSDTMLTGDWVNERLGSSLFIKDDTLVVGATTLGNPEGGGKVYVFVREGNTWVQRAIVQPEDSKSDDRFGISVYLENGYLAVGAGYSYVGPYPYAGKAYIFRYAAGTWHQQATLVPSDAETDAQFGTLVALNGNTAFVTAPGATVASTIEHGKLYFFFR